MLKRTLARAGSLLALASLAAGCHDSNAVVMGPKATGANAIFQNYVSLGNSITAGYQSGGINDSTQQRAYPVLLAAQMHTRFAYPALAMPGCAPPIDTFTTQHRVTPKGYPTSTSSTCYLRNPSSATSILNNVAVPGATSLDPFSSTTAASNALTTFILGGETQVQRALSASPTFATVWIGNNDVLGPATRGDTLGMTSPTTFASRYASTIDALVKGAPGLKGILIGVADVVNVPHFFSPLVLYNPQYNAGFSQLVAGAAQKPVTAINVDATTCGTPTAPRPALLAAQAIVLALAGQVQATGTTTPTVACSPVVPGVGDAGVLDSAEIAVLRTRVATYNAYIRAKADSIGFGYMDINPTLAAAKADPTKVKPYPDLAAPTNPFGSLFSLDGIHPSSLAHRVITDSLVSTINRKYSTSLQQISVP